MGHLIIPAEVISIEKPFAKRAAADTLTINSPKMNNMLSMETTGPEDNGCGLKTNVH